jgi:purine-cytosine permease-like protein
MQRLEEQLRQGSASAPATPASATPAPAESAPAWEPALDHPAPGHVFPSPYQPFTDPVTIPSAPPFEPPATPADWQDAPPPSAAAPTPPPLVEPPGFGTAPIPPAAPAEGVDYVAPHVLPPTGDVRLEDVQGLPPPIGQQAAPLPPYDPNAPVVPASGAPPISPGAFAGPYATPVAGPEPAPLPRPLPGADNLPSLDDHDENDDAVDAVDRLFGTPPVVEDGFAAAGPFPSEPIATSRVTDTQPGLLDQSPENHPVFVVESAGVEPTALDLRAGRAARLFWLWFAVNSSVVSLAIGAVLLSMGISLRQAIVAALAGVALSFLPLGLGTLAGKWSGQPAMVVSRATFGHAGNILPAFLGVLTRVFWGGVLLWVLAVSTGKLLVFGGLDAGLGESVWTFVVLGIGGVLALVIALFGYGFVALLQLVTSIVSGLLVAGLIAITYPRLDLTAALAIGDGAWTLVLGGAVLVFSFVGLAWVQSSSDLARYQRTSSSGAQSMLWASLGATLPPFVLIVWGAMLSASDPDVAGEMAEAPLFAIARMLPLWYPAPLLAVAGLGLVSSIVLAMYSGGFALQAVGLRARRSMTTLVSAVLVVAVAAGLVVLAADAFSISRDLATTLAVPVAAWAGIFSAEMMIRTRRFDSPSLLAPGGVYPQVRVVNLIGLLVISAAGFGLTSATFPGLTWQGFLFPLMGIPMEDPFARSDVGVLVALVLGVMLALATAIPVIRRQERESLRLEHTGPVPRITGAVPRVTGPTPRLEP